MTEVTTEVKEPTAYELAAEFVKNNAVSEITERIAKQTEEIKQLRNAYEVTSKELRNWKNSVTEFIKEHVKDDAIDVDDLKEFANELNIELTKEIEVTFKVDVKFTATVPLDFNINDIDESDFDVRVDYNGNHEDVEVDEDYVDVEDFEVSE